LKYIITMTNNLTDSFAQKISLKLSFDILLIIDFVMTMYIL